MNMATRGIRNCNPLNIRRNPANSWRGLRSEQEDPDFCQFLSMTLGLRAAIKLLQNYIKGGHNSVRKIITRWAPPSENDTEMYIHHVCTLTGIAPDTVLHNARWTIYHLVKAMAYMESGYKVTDEAFCEAWRLL